MQSDDDGDTWSESVAVAYEGNSARCFDPCLWIDPKGRLWFTWNVEPESCTYAAVCDNPDQKTLEWSQPRVIGKAVMMNKPVVLSTGEWLFPIAVWPNNLFPSLREKSDDCRPFVYRTNDEGATFERIGGPVADDISYDEHMIVELSDGVLLMFIPGNHDIKKSYSYDRGISWTRAESSGIKSPSARFHIRRLNDESFLFINHYKFNGRNNLTAMLSDDDCRTWKGYLMIDERSGVSYPDAKETPDGYIYIFMTMGAAHFCTRLKKPKKPCVRFIWLRSQKRIF